MPVLNDFGDAAYARVVAQLDAFAAALGIPKEIIRQYWSDTAHLPQTLDELKAWGMKPDREYGQVRYDAATGRWNPLGTGPTPGKTDLERGGFPHFITNNVGEAQRFQQVDAGGNIFGGSWDPAFNAAHRAGALPVATGPRTAQGDRMSGAGVTFNAQAGNPYPPGSTEAGVWDSANPAPGTGPAATPTSAPGGGGGGGSPAAGGAPSGGGGVGLNEGAASAANAAVLAFLEKRRQDEIDIPALRLKTETELAQMRRDDALAVWKQAYEKANLTGSIDGSPTLDATKVGADITGYTAGAGAAGNGQRVLDAIASLRTDPQYQALDGAGRRAMEAARVVQATGGALTQAQALQAVEQMRATTQTAGGFAAAPSTPQQIEGILRTVAPGTATFDREKEATRAAEAAATLAATRERDQATSLTSVLGLLSNLRGPENAFAYANTLANVPESIRANIQAAMARLPVTARNPAQTGVFGDLGIGQAGPDVVSGSALGPTYQMRTASAPPSATGQPAAALPPGTVPGATAAAPYGAGMPPGFFPSMTSTNPVAPAAGPDVVSGVGVGPGPMTLGPDGVASHQPVYGPRTQPIRPAVAAGMALPGQLSPTDWNRTTDYNRQLLLAGYENAGEDKANVLDEYKRSLPRAYGPRTGRLRAA